MVIARKRRTRNGWGRHNGAALVDLAREVSRLDAERARRQLEDLDPQRRAVIYRIALALGFPWPVDGRLDGRRHRRA